LSFLFLLRAEEIAIQEIRKVSKWILLSGRGLYGLAADARELLGKLSSLFRLQRFGLPETEGSSAQRAAKGELVRKIGFLIAAHGTESDRTIGTPGAKNPFPGEPGRNVHSIPLNAETNRTIFENDLQERKLIVMTRFDTVPNLPSDQTHPAIFRRIEPVF